MDDGESTAAKRLLGLTLENGWKVVATVEKTGSQTGGFFSHGYIAESAEGSQAFLKAMDFSDATKEPDFARAIESIAKQFNFERDLLEFCRERRMRNVVRSIGGGLVDVVGDGNPLNRVQYFLFEPADGDLRRVMDSYDELTTAWCLKVLHESALGLWQLHQALVAHQDVKPSNILSFGGDKAVKVGDLGCASMRGQACPRDGLNIPGQKSYAPPEQLYSYSHPDWVARRIGSDMYQLGSLCCFLFIGPTMNGMLADAIEPGYWWTDWAGSYEEVKPQLKLAFGKVMNEVSERLNAAPLDAVATIIRELCEPELTQRGDPSRVLRKGQQFSLEPYVSRFGNLRRAAEYAAKQVIR